ncbi:MAG TPA: glycosyltransferase family 9 protein [Phycisphaerae bacterium]|nr:glycosyltransferase family 9 protein [Phycisphaerae bacterium]
MNGNGFRRICLIHVGAIGDFVLALRLVAMLKATWPRATLEVLGRPETASIALGRAGVDAIASVETLGLHTFFVEGAELDAKCREYFAQFDLVVDMLGGPGSTFAANLGTCVDCVVSIESRLRPDWRGHISDQWIEDLLAADIGVEGSDRPLPILPFDRAERFEARARLQKHTPTAGQPIVLLHPGAGGTTKCWPIESFQALAGALHQDDMQAIFLVGPVELDVFGDPLVESLRAFAPVLREVALTEAAALIAAADAYVGNDSGMTHLAAAVESSTIALFGPTEPSAWRPLGPNVRVLTGAADGKQPFAGLDVATVHHTVLSCLEKPPISA